MLNLSLNYRNYKVTKGHILFVTPDGDDQVHDKEYLFNDAEDSRLKQLIGIVHHYLTTLDFLQDDDIFLPPDKNKSMKHINAFIDQLLEKVEGNK